MDFILEFEWLPRFSFLVFAIHGHFFSFKYSSSFVWDSHTLLDRGNLCHSDILYRLCCLLRFLCPLLFGIFVQHFWHLVLASQFVCHFYSHFFLVWNIYTTFGLICKNLTKLCFLTVSLTSIFLWIVFDLLVMLQW